MIEQLNTVSTLDVIPPSANYVSGLSDRKSQRRGHNNSENGRGMEDLVVGAEEAEANLLSSDSIVKLIVIGTSFVEVASTTIVSYKMCKWCRNINLRNRIEMINPLFISHDHILSLMYDVIEYCLLTSLLSTVFVV
ncbi:hypothetical protein ACOSP7_014170 [Xanthoceras sorbifolium]